MSSEERVFKSITMAEGKPAPSLADLAAGMGAYSGTLCLDAGADVSEATWARLKALGVEDDGSEALDVDFTCCLESDEDGPVVVDGTLLLHIEDIDVSDVLVDDEADVEVRIAEMAYESCPCWSFKPGVYVRGDERWRLHGLARAAGRFTWDVVMSREPASIMRGPTLRTFEVHEAGAWLYEATRADDVVRADVAVLERRLAHVEAEWKRAVGRLNGAQGAAENAARVIAGYHDRAKTDLNDYDSQKGQA